MKLLYLDPHDVEPDPEGFREEPGDVEGLAETIAEQGMLQPLGVVPISNNRYRVVYGNRRREAALKLGMQQIPCVLLDGDYQDLLLRQLIENVQREELNDMEKARAFSRLRQRIAETHEHLSEKLSESELDESVGKAVGLTGRTVRRYTVLLELPQVVQDLIRREQLNVTQAQHLRRISNPETQIEVAKAVVEEGMSAADMNRLVGYFIANPSLTIESALQSFEQPNHLPHHPLSETEGAESPQGQGGGGGWSDDDDRPPWDEGSVGGMGGSGAPLTGMGDRAGDSSRGGGPLNGEEPFGERRKPKRMARIRSLDQMIDEVERLSRSSAEGDIEKWLKKDEQAPEKFRTLREQLQELMHDLERIADEQGWS